MKHDYFKYYNSRILLTLIVLILSPLLLIKEYWLLSISSIAVITAILMFISTYLWKYKPFNHLFWVDDFSGRYEGFLHFQYKDDEGNLKTGKLPHVKTIKQNGHGITVTSFTLKESGVKSSKSVCKALSIEKTKDEQHFKLTYDYLNEGSTEQNFSKHEGTDIIEFIRNGTEKTLSGGYYTGREPYQTKGEYSKLKWVSNDLNHNF